MNSYLPIISARPYQLAEVLVLSRVCTISLSMGIRNGSYPAHSENRTEHLVDACLKVGYKVKFAVYTIYLVPVIQSYDHGHLVNWVSLLLVQICYLNL